MRRIGGIIGWCWVVLLGGVSPGCGGDEAATEAVEAEEEVDLGLGRTPSENGGMPGESGEASRGTSASTGGGNFDPEQPIQSELPGEESGGGVEEEKPSPATKNPPPNFLPVSPMERVLRLCAMATGIPC